MLLGIRELFCLNFNNNSIGIYEHCVYFFNNNITMQCIVYITLILKSISINANQNIIFSMFQLFSLLIYCTHIKNKVITFINVCADNKI